MDDLHTRVARLEREARIWRVIALTADGPLGFGLASPVIAQDEQEATTLKAPDGKPLVGLPKP